jgi:DNA-binding SARP family transcriptional activator/tetratricopeptide (TPR) repeat protein
MGTDLKVSSIGVGDQAVDLVLPGQVLLVVAAAGYGKTTGVRSRLRGRPARWYSGAEAAAVLRGTAPDGAGSGPGSGATPHSGLDPTPRRTTEPQPLILDDPAAPRGAVGNWLAGVLAAPPPHPVVLITRRPPGTRLAKSRMDGVLAEVGPEDLAMTPSAVGRLLTAEYELGDPALAHRLHRSTLGWPALVHLAARAVAARPDADDDALTAPGGAVAEYLLEEVLDGLDEDVRYLVEAAAHVGALTSELAVELDAARPTECLGELTRLGLLRPLPVGPGRHGVVPLLGTVVRRHRPWPKSERRHLLKVAAAWHESVGDWGAAARAHRLSGDISAVGRITTAHGPRILARDGMRTFIELAESVPRKDWSRATRLVHGEALALTGDAEGARDTYLDLAGDDEDLAPALARRLGFLEYRIGDYQAALRIYGRALMGAEDTVDEAILLAWAGMTHWSAGSFALAGEYAERAQRAAIASGDYRARIAAHLALGFTAEVRGEPEVEQRHYDAALEIAEANGDTIQTVMARNNRAARLLGEGRLAEALAEADRAVQGADAVDLRAILGPALVNSGGVLRQLGRLDEALDRFEHAVAVEHRMASGWLAYPLTYVGDLHRIRGQSHLARAAYEEAVRIAETWGDRYGLVPGLAGLALLLADTDPPAATEAARRALESAAGPMTVKALIAAGHAARGRGDRAEALRFAQEAAAQARRHRDRCRLAEALELVAVVSDAPKARRGALAEALAIWLDRDAVLDAHRVRAVLGHSADATAAERGAAGAAREELAVAGVPMPAWACSAAGPDARIRTLGRFDVVAAGRTIPGGAWQSRKARDLLRVLVARRGRPVSREELGSILWGDDDPGKVAHRLSVALSTVRSVLDPGRAAPSDHFLVAQAGGVFLDVTRIAVDVEHFLADAEHGLRLRERGHSAEARAVLETAERAYTGDFLEDELYDDVAVPTRELARSTYLQVVRVLVEIHRQRGEMDRCVRGLHRILDKDPYDEQGHRDLIEILELSGSHGEAQRAKERYRHALAELGL